MTSPTDTDRSPATSTRKPDVTRRVIDEAKALGPVSVIAALCAALPAIGGFALLLWLVGRLKPWIDQQGPSAAAWFAAVFALATGVAILPTYALSFAAGHFFGFGVGGLAAVAGVTVGSLIGYGWASLVARKRVMARVESDQRARAVRTAIVDRGLAGTIGVVALLRFPPNSPFAITNLVMAATRVPLLPFIVGTAIGMAPRTLLAAWLGAQAPAGLAFGEALKTGGGRWKVIGFVVSLVVVLLVFHLFSKWGRRALQRLGAADALRGREPEAAADA